MERKHATVFLERRSGAERRQCIETSEQRRGSDRRRLESIQTAPRFLPGDARSTRHAVARAAQRDSWPLHALIARAGAALAGIARRLWRSVNEYRQRRNTYRQLANLEPRLLRDIGVGPEEIDLIYRKSGRYSQPYDLPGIGDWYHTRRPSL